MYIGKRLMVPTATKSKLTQEKRCKQLTISRCYKTFTNYNTFRATTQKHCKLITRDNNYKTTDKTKWLKQL